MNKRKPNKKFLIPLVIITIIIWGIIVKNIIAYYSNDSVEKTEVISLPENMEITDSVKKENSSFVNTIYLSLPKDPFVFHDNPERITKQETKINRLSGKRFNPNNGVSPKSLNYSIKGIIINASNKMVLLEDRTENNTVFLRERDFYKNIRIKKINAGVVELEEDGSTKTVIVK